MFGSPLLTTFIITFLFLGGGLLGFSILNISPTVQVKTEEKEDTETELKQLVSITVRSAHELQSISGSIDKTEIKFEQITPYEAEAEILSGQLLEFTLSLKWSDETPETAVLIQAIPEAKLAVERTIWAQGNLTEEFTFFLK